MSTPNKISRALEKTLERARQESKYVLDPGKRYVIFSDHHKGARTGADDFEYCESTYMSALTHYDEQLFTLIVLGDVEELWEERAHEVIKSYPDVFTKEAAFYEVGRYIRIYGNHDDFWDMERNVDKYLGAIFPGIKALDGIVFDFRQNGNTVGEILLVHGHQGVYDRGIFTRISRIAVRWFWSVFQKLTGKGRTTPAEDECLRGKHDTMLYSWANEKDKLILIAGHTHRPVWSSMTHLEQLRNELFTLQSASPRPGNYDTDANRLLAEIRKKEIEDPPCNDTIKTNPCYFNTGCTSFGDGDITAIELEGGWIRLVKWEKEDGMREPLQTAQLTDIFFQL